MKPLLIIWYRDLLQFWRNRVRAVSSLAMPIIWLVLFGSGISGSLKFSGPATAGFDYIQFIFPGVLGLTVLFTAMFGALSIVVDREYGFLKEILVAPIPRGSIAIGKILGGATVAGIQGLLMIVLLPLVGLKWKWELIYLVPFVFIFATMVSAIGVFAASRIKNTEAFQMVMQFLTFPMFMLSGALFPLKDAPVWLDTISKFNPATYGVNMLRSVTFAVYDVPTQIRDAFNITIFDKTVTPFWSTLVVLYIGVVLAALATWFFARQES